MVDAKSDVQTLSISGTGRLYIRDDGYKSQAADTLVSGVEYISE